MLEKINLLFLLLSARS
jgi:alpha-ketoglutarate-dependent taurine dioxygenase